MVIFALEAVTAPQGQCFHCRVLLDSMPTILEWILVYCVYQVSIVMVVLQILMIFHAQWVIFALQELSMENNILVRPQLTIQIS